MLRGRPRGAPRRGEHSARSKSGSFAVFAASRLACVVMSSGGESPRGDGSPHIRHLLEPLQRVMAEVASSARSCCARPVKMRRRRMCQGGTSRASAYTDECSSASPKPRGAECDARGGAKLLASEADRARRWAGGSGFATYCFIGASSGGRLGKRFSPPSSARASSSRARLANHRCNM